MFGTKVYIRNDFWPTCDSFKKPVIYIGEVVSKKSKLNKKGEVEWNVELEDWPGRYYWIPEDELATSKQELKDIIRKRQNIEDEKNVVYSRVTDDLYADPTWKKGCETKNETGKRRGQLCNCPYYKHLNGLKKCKKHSEEYIDVTDDVSVYEEGENDELEYDDYDFIAEEDDGTKIINGKRLVYQSDSEYENESETDDSIQITIRMKNKRRINMNIKKV